MTEFDVVTYTVINGGLIGAEGRIVSNSHRAIIRIRDFDRTETDDVTIDALLKKAESGVDELAPLLASALLAMPLPHDARDLSRVAVRTCPISGLESHR